MRQDELERLCDMVNQLALTVSSDVMIVPDHLVHGIVRAIRNVAPDGQWNSLPQRASVRTAAHF